MTYITDNKHYIITVMYRDSIQKQKPCIWLCYRALCDTSWWLYHSIFG